MGALSSARIVADFYETGAAGAGSKKKKEKEGKKKEGKGKGEKEGKKDFREVLPLLAVSIILLHYHTRITTTTQYDDNTM